MPRLTLLAFAALLFTSVAARDTAGAQDTQGVLGPGLYVFQTRLDRATCEDDSETGYVTSYFAAIDGTPASRRMSMKLTNSTHWPEWQLTIAPDGQIVATATNGSLHQRAEMRPNGSRFTGRGYREYQGRGGRRCRFEYDALLRKLHD